MKRNLLFFAVILTFVGITILVAQQQQDDGRARTQAATTALKNLVELTDAETAKMAGVSLEQLRTAKLGNPLPLQYINTELVLKTDSFSNLTNYLTPNTEYYYPIEAEGAAIASVEVLQDKQGKWITGPVGGFKTSQSFNNIISQFIKSDTSITANSLRVVHSGPHGILFLAFQKGTQQLLTPIISRPDVNLRAGQLLTEKEALQKLKEIYKLVKMDKPD